MNKMLQFVFTLQCLTGLAGDDNSKTNKNGLRRIEDMFDKAAGAILFCGLLAYGIYKEWIKIPMYMKDRADYNYKLSIIFTIIKRKNQFYREILNVNYYL